MDETVGEWLGTGLLREIARGRNGEERIRAPTAFHGVGRGIRCVVQWGDFTFLGLQKDLDEAVAFLKKPCELKVRDVVAVIAPKGAVS